LAQQQNNENNKKIPAREKFLQRQSPELLLFEEHGRCQWQPHK